jgi:hypothetical protein
MTGISHGAAPDSRGGRVAVAAGGLLNAPHVVDVLADAGYGVVSLPVSLNRTLLRCVVIDAHQYAARGYAVRKVGVRGQPEDGLHRNEWSVVEHALRLTDLTVPEFIVSVDAGSESLEHLGTFLRNSDG